MTFQNLNAVARDARGAVCGCLETSKANAALRYGAGRGRALAASLIVAIGLLTSACSGGGGSSQLTTAASKPASPTPATGQAPATTVAVTTLPDTSDLGPSEYQKRRSELESELGVLTRSYGSKVAYE
jgi:hypothetical protein